MSISDEIKEILARSENKEFIKLRANEEGVRSFFGRYRKLADERAERIKFLEELEADRARSNLELTQALRNAEAVSDNYVGQIEIISDFISENFPDYFYEGPTNKGEIAKDGGVQPIPIFEKILVLLRELVEVRKLAGHGSRKQIADAMDKPLFKPEET